VRVVVDHADRLPATDDDGPLGANVRAIRVKDFPRRVNRYGQAGGDHASSRTGLDDPERQTGIYGLEGRARCVPDEMVD
jgi:hypothetical protein